MSECRGCEHPVEWVTMVSGKRMPEPADTWEHGFNDCLNAVLAVVSPVCPECARSSE